jgi:molybdate transport system substrate-binding protein
LVAGVLSVALVSGCGSSDDSSSAASGTVMVFAAASLKKTFTEIGERFKTENPGTSVEFNFAGSSDLVTQLTQGASADVFASADTKNMDKAAQEGLLAGDAVNFASNTLVIATAPGNPKKITSFADPAKPDLSVVTCAPQVPCGSATQKVEQATSVTLNPVSEESSVSDVLNKVTTGQADAGLVYVTDAKGAGTRSPRSVEVNLGSVMATVKVRLDGGDQVVTSSITKDAAVGARGGPGRDRLHQID